MTDPTDHDAARFNDLLALTSDWYWEQDAGFRYTYYSARYYELSGTDPKDRIGTRRWDHPALNMKPEDWARHRALLEAHQPFHDLELCAATSGGGVRWCSVSGLPVFGPDGRFTGYRGIARDTTEKKLAEAALDSARRRLETAIEAGRFGIWETDLVARRAYLSAGWSEMLGGPPDTTYASLEDLTKLSHPDDLARLQAAQRAAIRGETGSYQCTHRVRHRDGSWRWVFSRGRITERDPAGRALRMTGTLIDVTEEMRVRQTLRDKEAVLRTVLDSVPAMIARIDRDYRITYANRKYAESAGTTTESIAGRPVREVIGRERADDAEPWFRRALAGETVSFKRVRMDDPAGPRHFDVTLTPDIDADGNVNGCFTLVTEFTGIAQAQSVLRDKEAELRTILDSVPAMIARTSRDYRFVYANRSYAAFEGLVPEDLAGRPVREILGQERADANEPWFRRALAGETVTYKRTLSLPGSGMRHFDITMIPDFGADGRIQGTFALVNEVTDAVRGQASLLHKERELNHLLDTIPALVARIGLDERYTYANLSFAKEYGKTPDQVVGRTVTELIGPQFRTQLAELLTGRVAAGETVEYERELTTGDGGKRHFHVYLAPDLDGAGIVRGAYLFGIDITERKAQEMRAEALLAQVRAANLELESFAYTVSHDLRAPLRAIGGFAEILERDSAGSLDAQGTGHLHRITSNAKRMTDLIDGLLQLSRLARLPVGKRRLSPAQLVAEVVADHEAEIAARNVRLRIDPMPECSADPLLLKQVFANLVGNAFKYTARQAAPEISIGSEPSPEGTVYYVRDNGAGFDMDYADKLFGVFQRLHGESEFPGTGIGLATVKRIVERHGGRVWAEGAEGRGASFYFTLGA